MNARTQPTLYRARYSWPDGRRSYVTFAALPCDALRWAGDFCRSFGAELLAIAEDRALNLNHSLTLE